MFEASGIWESTQVVFDSIVTDKELLKRKNCNIYVPIFSKKKKNPMKKDWKHFYDELNKLRA